MQLNEIDQTHEHATTSLKVLLLVFALVLIGALCYLVWNEKSVSYDSDTSAAKTATSVVKEDEAKLIALADYKGSATATSDFKAGTFTHSLSAILGDVATDKFYEGWLVRGKTGDADFAFVSTGKLLQGADGMWTTSFTSTTDYGDYTNVVVTLETLANGLDGVPETHILEGAFIK